MCPVRCRPRAATATPDNTASFATWLYAREPARQASLTPKRSPGQAVSAAALFACHPVEAFAQQIGMAQVPGVLLDQVQAEPAQRVRVRLAERVLELVSRHDLPGPGAVRAECAQVRGGPGGGDGLEVSCLVLVGAVQ